MKVLIVSFDKTLTESLQKALEDHEVYVAKNSEEAIKMIPSDVEAVIYDAISGAISEEDINTLYTKKFSNARYLILYDELFPVDQENIIAPQKLLVPRDTDPKEVVQKLVEFEPEEVKEEKPEESVPEAPEEFEIEPTALEVTQEVEEETTEAEEEAPQEEAPQVQEVTEEKEVSEQPQEGGKVLIVSFDQTLIDTLKASLGQKYDVVSVKTVKQAMEQAKDARLVVFDAISGVIAEKGLIEMAGDPEIAGKPFVILVDDLFPINVEGIPLEKKVAVSRDTDPERLKEIVREELEKATAVGEVAEKTEEEEAVQTVEEATVQEEESAVEEIVEEVAQPPEEFEIEPVTQEETIQEIVEEAPEIEVEEVPQEEEEVPALEALEKIMEEQNIEVEQVSEEEEAETVEETVQQAAVPQVEAGQIDLDSLIENAVSKALSEDRIKEAVLNALRDSMGDIRDMISEVIKQEVNKAFEELDIRNLVRQATYQALKERLEELIS